MTMETPDSSQNNKFHGSYPEPYLIPEGLRPAYRFLLGRPMDNKVRTDSTFRHRARGGYPSKWLRLAGWERAVIRLAVTYVLVWLLVVSLAGVLAGAVSWVGWEVPGVLRVLQWRVVLEVHLLMSLGVLVPLGTYRHVRDFGVRVMVPVLVVSRLRVRVEQWVPYEIHGRRDWEIERVRPVAAVAAHILALSMRPEQATSWVTVPRNYRDPEGSPVEIMLPPTFSGADEGMKRRLTMAVGHRLGMKDPAVTWDLEGSTPRMRVSSPPEPPGEVSFDEVRDLLMQVDEYRPLLGLAGGQGKAAYAEMIKDSPHVAISAGPGAGKSTLAKLLIMQVLRWGWGVVILDWKQTEAYEWAIGLPGVRYLTKLEDIHDMGVRVGEEVDDRKANGLTGRAKVLYVRDEWNATADLLMAYYQRLRQTADPEERKTMPTRSPALHGYAVLDFAGREYGMHDMVIGQRLSSRAFNGNTDIRECFGIRILGRYTENTKKMLVGNIKPFPKPSNIPGRWTVVSGPDIVVVQSPIITAEEARLFAQGGVPNPKDPLTRHYFPELGQGGSGSSTASALGDQFPHGATATLTAEPEVEVEDAEIVDARKLSEMVHGLSHLRITLKVLQKAAGDSASGFPGAIGGSQFKGYTYDYQAVQEWARKRHARMRSEKEVNA